MSFISLVFGLGGPQTTIGALPLDALLSESTELPSNISAYAVEDGPPTTDHITQDAERLSLSGVVTAASVLMFGAGGRSKLIAAKDALRQIHEQRLPLTIVTGMDMYENMGMSNAKIGRTNKSDQLTIDCEFQKIRKASVRKADIPPEKVAQAEGAPAGSGAKGKAGQTAAKGGKVSTSSPNQSTLHESQHGKIKAALNTGGTIST